MKCFDEQDDAFVDVYPVVGGVLHSLTVSFQGLTWPQGTSGLYRWDFDRETGRFAYQWVPACDVAATYAELDTIAHRIVADLFKADDDPTSIFSLTDEDDEGTHDKAA